LELSKKEELFKFVYSLEQPKQTTTIARINA